MLYQNIYAQSEDHRFQYSLSQVHFNFPLFHECLSYPEEIKLHRAHPWRFEPFYSHSLNPLAPRLMTASGQMLMHDP